MTQSVKLNYQGTDISAGHYRVERYSRIHSLLETLAAGRSIVDIGCNTGLLTLLSAKEGACRAIGVDKRVACLQDARRSLRSWQRRREIASTADVMFLEGCVTEHLDVLRQAEVVIMVRVLYHLGPKVYDVFDAISSDAALLIQGNVARRDKARREATPWGNALAMTDRAVDFVKSYGFKVTNRVPAKTDILVCRRG